MFCMSLTFGISWAVVGAAALRTLGTADAGCCVFFFFSSRRRHTRLQGDWSSDVCSSDLRDYVKLTVGPHVVVGDFEGGHSDEERGKLSAVHFVRFALPPGARRLFREEIGRASCRERV